MNLLPRLWLRAVVLSPIVLSLLLSDMMRSMPPAIAQPIRLENRRSLRLARREDDRFPPNPLLIEPTTPLPSGTTRALREQIVTLNQQAMAQLDAGRAEAAFKLWNQQLRLSRALGLIEETAALAQVGQIAWERNNTQQVRYISQRLQQIQVLEQKAPDPALRQQLTAAYQVIRAPALALQVDARTHQLAQTQGHPRAAFLALNRIAQTHLDWFDYRQATLVYQDLLNQAQAQENQNNQIAYSYQLAYINEQVKQPLGAIAAFETLIPLYAATADPQFLADFQTRLATQYRLNQQLDRAERTYQAAYRTAEKQQQTGLAGDALRQLAALYEQQQRWDAAIQVYDFLTTFEIDAGLNLYNAMDAYDRLATVWLKQQDPAQAIVALRKGRQIAQALAYREAYFTERLDALSAPENPQ